MAKQHIVVCQECGKQFDAAHGGYYNSATRRYTCKSCGKRLKADARESATGMRQSSGAMIVKIAVGVLFIIAAFSTGSVGGTLTGIVVGLALIAWGLLPWWKVKKAEKDEADRIRAAQEAEAFARANEPKVCPACGAKTKGEKCEYCGSPLS